MKKNIIILCAFLLSATLYSQNQNRREQVKTLKIAYITEKLDLTQSEAQNFWPVYNDFEEKSNELRRQARQLRHGLKLESITDDEALKLIKENTILENKKQELTNQFTDDLLKVIPAKKVILLKKAEEDFKRRMIEEFKKRRQERRN